MLVNKLWPLTLPGTVARSRLELEQLILYERVQGVTVIFVETYDSD